YKHKVLPATTFTSLQTLFAQEDDSGNFAPQDAIHRSLYSNHPCINLQSTALVLTLQSIAPSSSIFNLQSSTICPRRRLPILFRVLPPSSSSSIFNLPDFDGEQYGNDVHLLGGDSSIKRVKVEQEVESHAIGGPQSVDQRTDDVEQHMDAIFKIFTKISSMVQNSNSFSLKYICFMLKFIIAGSTSSNLSCLISFL
ncbi:hypothetical protein Ccrd_014877, partial [Cynara cardunculus var. scolymus]